MRFRATSIFVMVMLSMSIFAGNVLAEEKSYEGVKLTVGLDGGFSARPFHWAVDAMEKEYGIKLKIQEIPRYDIFEKLITEFIAGTGAYDIFILVPCSTVGPIFGGGYAYPLNEFIEKWDPAWDDIIPTIRELYLTWGDQVYGLPYDGDAHILYYRKDLFSDPTERTNFRAKNGYELRAPQTWGEYLDIAEFFTRKKGEILAGEVLKEDFYGVSEALGKGEGYAWTLDRFVSYGAGFFDEDMNPTINTEAGVKALQNIIDSTKFAPPGVLHYNYTEQKDVYLKGRVAMEIQWTDIGILAEDPEMSSIVGKTGYAIMPGVKEDNAIVHRSFLPGGRLMAIAQTCKNPEAAYRVLQYICSPEVSLRSTLGIPEPTGCDPYRYSHFQSPKFRNLWPDAGDWADVILKTLEHGVPELILPGAPEYYSTLTDHMQKAVLGEMSPQDALDTVASDWRKINKKYGLEEQKEIFQDFLERSEKIKIAM